MTVIIDKQLRLVVPVYQGDDVLYVYSQPIGREVFERFFRLFSKTFALIYSEAGSIAGPRMAKLYLKAVAEDMRIWEGPTGAEEGLIAEIIRMTNVLMPLQGGWKMVMFQDVINQKLMDETDLSEVENAIVFFTLASHMHRRSDLKAHLDGSSVLWGAQITSLTLSEYRNSLPPSTVDETGSKTSARKGARQSSIPS